MLQLEGYTLHNKIYTSPISEVYKATRLADNKPVVLKVCSEKDFLSPKRRRPFQQEYTLGRIIQSPYVIDYLDLLITHDAIIIVESDGGNSLDKIIPARGFPLLPFLQMAIQLAKGLQAIQACNIIHKDIKPSNILYDKETKQIKFTDFGLATRLKEEFQDTVTAQHLTGSFPFMSPEQTGRMNRVLDSRTDFYSLGITYYQLITGRLPFTSIDTLEILHCHLAQKPTAPHEVRKSIPVVVSNIIMKLLEKNAEDRYQSSDGLLHDLETSIHYLETTGEIPDFPLATADRPFGFRIIEKLYGREQEVDYLIDAFTRACNGDREVLMISGCAGIGKTSLIQEIYKPVTAQKTYFLRGKFDQLSRNVAYSAILQAFQGLIKQLLTEPEERLAEWRSKLLQSLGNNAQMLINGIPELEFIIGKQPTLAEVSSIENQNRFQRTFIQFIKIFCQENKPLVLFLDDLQWADLSSLQLIKIMLEEEDLSHFMLIGAYRDNEASIDHPTRILLDSIEQEISFTSIVLNNLSPNNINTWISDTLNRKPVETLALTQLIIQKTEGNPFFIKILLNILYEKNYINFSNGKWEFDLDKITHEPAMDNVVTLLIKKVEKLPVDLRNILKIASCLGNRFTLHELSTIMGIDIDILNDSLIEIANRDIIIKGGEQYTFSHDRIQEAAYSLMTEEEKNKSNLTIGRILLNNNQKEINQEDLYAIVGHYNKAKDLLDQDQEKLKLSKLNLQASKFAKSSIAYAASLHYLQAGLSYLPNNRWQSYYELTLQLNLELAETLYLNGNFDESESIIQEIRPYLQDRCDIADANNLLIIQKTMLAQYKESIAIARNTLKLFNINFPEENLEEFLQKTIYNTHNLLKNKTVDDLFNLPEMIEREHRSVMKILYNVIAACYIDNPILYGITGLMMAAFSIEHGNSTESCVGYSSYGMVACNVLGDFKTGLEFARLSTRLSEKFNDPIQKARACTVLGLLVNHWIRPLKESAEILDEGYKVGIEAGEMQFAGYLLFGQALILVYYGVSIKRILEETKKFLHYANKTKNQIIIDAVEAICFALGDLLSEPMTDRQEYIENCLAHRSFVALSCYYTIKAQIAYLHEDIHAALNFITQAQKYMSNAMGFIFVATSVWWHSLILIKFYPKADEQEKPIILQKIKKNQEQTQMWVASCPENFSFRDLLVKAELSRLEEKFWEAEDYYEQAVKEAKNNGFMFGEIFSTELMADFLLNANRYERAKEYTKKVYQGYKTWGAEIKANLIGKKYAALMYEPLIEDWTKNYPRSRSRTIEYSATRIASFDLESVIRCARILSSNMDPKSLLVDGMQIIIENAGAQTGALLLKENELVLQAEYLSNKIVETEKQPLSIWDRGCRAIIAYVARTLMPVIVGDAASDIQYANNNYINANQVKSILCLPITLQNKLFGVLYLENNSASFAFTQKHFDILNVLSGQLAISLTNANLFQQLQQSEEKYRVLASASPVGMFILNVQEDSIVYINEKALEMMGITNQPTESIKWQDHIYTNDQLSVYTAWRKSIHYNRSFNAEFRFQRNHDNFAWVICKADPQHNDKGEIISYIVTITDISDRKEIERLAAIELEENKRRELQEQAKNYETRETEYTRHLCHELRNPLQGILGSAENAMSLIHEVLSESSADDNENKKNKLLKIETSLAAILACATHQQAVTTDALKVSSLLEHAITLDIQPVSIHKIFSDINLIFHEQCRNKNIELNLEIPEEDLWIKTDSLRLREIIINLTSNAIKFTETGSINIILIYKNITSDRVSFYIAVQDTGIGISEEVQKKLFFPFTQASSSTYSKYGGTGLGLYISKMTIELMKGKIGLQSKEGVGSRFFIDFECERAKPEEIPQASTNTAPLSPRAPAPYHETKSILIVEDNEINQTVIRNFLEKAQYVCEIAENGSIALEKLHDPSKHFDLILMDIQMPVMDGLKTTQIIRQEEKLGKGLPIPIIGLSGNAQKEDQDSALAAGMNEYLTKPIHKKELYSCLRKYFTEDPTQQKHVALLVA